jgi:hypothetical protein
MAGIIELAETKDPTQREFHQTVNEVLESIQP